MTHINKSPLAPASANRAHNSDMRGEYTKYILFAPPPYHISYYLNQVLARLAKSQQEEQ